MKPLHIVLFVAAGAAGGAVVMKMVQKPPAPVVEQRVILPKTAPAPAPVEAPVQTAAAPAPAAAAVEPVHPSPFEPPKEVAKASKPVREAPKVVRDVPTPVRAPRQKEFHLDARVWTSRQPTEPRLSAQVVVSTPSAAPPPPPEPVPAPLPVPVPPARTEPENVTPPPPAPPEPHRVTLNAGTLIPVRLVDGLTAERNLPGDSFTATLYKELVVDGFVIAERGARVDGRVVSSDRGGRVKGVSSLQVELIGLHLSDGQTVAVQTDTFERRAEPSRDEDAAKIGGGAALGAIIGAAAGGGKGAAIGAGVGGAAGAGDVMATRGKPAALQPETRVTFRLRAPVTITERLRA